MNALCLVMFSFAGGDVGPGMSYDFAPYEQFVSYESEVDFPLVATTTATTTTTAVAAKSQSQSCANGSCSSGSGPIRRLPIIRRIRRPIRLFGWLRRRR